MSDSDDVIVIDDSSSDSSGIGVNVGNGENHEVISISSSSSVEVGTRSTSPSNSTTSTNYMRKAVDLTLRALNSQNHRTQMASASDSPSDSSVDDGVEGLQPPVGTSVSRRKSKSSANQCTSSNLVTRTRKSYAKRKSPQSSSSSSPESFFSCQAPFSEGSLSTERSKKQHEGTQNSDDEQYQPGNAKEYRIRTRNKSIDPERQRKARASSSASMRLSERKRKRGRSLVHSSKIAPNRKCIAVKSRFSNEEGKTGSDTSSLGEYEESYQAEETFAGGQIPTVVKKQNVRLAEQNLSSFGSNSSSEDSEESYQAEESPGEIENLGGERKKKKILKKPPPSKPYSSTARWNCFSPNVAKERMVQCSDTAISVTEAIQAQQVDERNGNAQSYPTMMKKQLFQLQCSDGKLKSMGYSSSQASRSPWRVGVEDTLRQVRHEREEKRRKMLQKCLREKNKLLQNSNLPAHTQPLPRYLRLPRAENLGLDNRQGLQSCYLRRNENPLPRDRHHTIFVRKHFSSLGGENEDDSSAASNDSQEKQSDDHKIQSPKQAAPITPLHSNLNLRNANGAEDAELPNNLSPGAKNYWSKLSPTSKMYSRQVVEFRYPERIGAGYEEDEIDEEIDKVLERLKDFNHDRNEIHDYLAILLQQNIQRVKGRWAKANGFEEPRRQHETKYEDVMSSFRDLFCRRCLTFDCNLHGLPEDYPSSVQLELAIRKDNSGDWKNECPPVCLPTSNNARSNMSSIAAKNASATSQILSEEQKELCQRLYKLFQNDVNKVSQATGIPTGVICRQLVLEPFESQLSDPTPTGSSRSKSNSYPPEWSRRKIEAISHPFFNPCTHTEPCSEETCPCIQNGFFCMKACVWGAWSRNFFHGCNCNSKCTSNKCPCFAANRECDPDLCRRCGACTDPPNQLPSNQKCRNDNVGMRRHVHLLLGKSRVAGWGLFTKFDLKKGDYVHEYLGELIDQNEAERRGETYDKNNQTYIFDMSTDYAVDALRKGNKTRFINHSDTPNIGPKMKVVNGDYRIGFFALKDIPAQTELFFNYGDKFLNSSGGFHLKRASNKG